LVLAWLACVSQPHRHILADGFKAFVMKRVLIIGGYGNFGSHIARSLDSDDDMRLIIGGRSQARADALAQSLRNSEGAVIDIDGELAAALARINPDIVIHTTGPFQKQDYSVACACITQGCHYIDLADARDFVAGIGGLDESARIAGVLAVSGASSVPCLTAAIVDHYLPRFRELTTLDYGISAAQQTNRGLATTSAVLSYVGRPFQSWRDGRSHQVFGWQDTHSERYPELGRRWFGNCDIPDLVLFPRRYPGLRNLRFAAGHELSILHFGTWLLSWPVRLGLLPGLDRFAEPLLKLAFLFDRFGSGRSGFHMVLSGTGTDGAPKAVRFLIVARSGHGPYIPCMPAILLARKLAAGPPPRIGATPCLDLIGLDEYMAALGGLDISVIRDE
jgi:NAD(P)-dependent dehydrogenase (short-subunit alcohol dehydrogenase family)